jgi:hypothetical protein
MQSRLALTVGPVHIRFRFQAQFNGLDRFGFRLLAARSVYPLTAKSYRGDQRRNA